MSRYATLFTFFVTKNVGLDTYAVTGDGSDGVSEVGSTSQSRYPVLNAVCRRRCRNYCRVSTQRTRHSTDHSTGACYTQQLSQLVSIYRRVTTTETKQQQYWHSFTHVPVWLRPCYLSFRVAWHDSMVLHAFHNKMTADYLLNFSCDETET